MALLFWLDRKDKEDKEKEERIYKGIYDLLSKLNWNISRHQMDGKFPEMEFLDLEEQGELDCVSYKHKSCENLIANFYFPKEKSRNLLGIDIYLPRLSKEKRDTIFHQLCEKYGEPEESDFIEEASLDWNRGNGILVLEQTNSGMLILGFWNKEFYQIQSEGIS